MSLILTEGFDLYGTTDPESDDTCLWLLDSRWARDSYVYARIRATDGRRAGGCLAVVGYNSYVFTGYHVILDAGQELTTLKIGFAYYVHQTSHAPASNYPIIWFGRTASTSDVQCNITRTNAGSWQIRGARDGAVLGATPEGLINAQNWHYVELSITCSSSGSFTMRVDGTQVYSVSGINTQALASGGIRYIVFRKYDNESTMGHFTRIDDLYLLDSTGSYFNDFLGDVAIEGHLFTADGTDGDWDPSTPGDHYSNINVLGRYYGSNYIEGDTVGKKDSFTITPTEYAEGILGVEVAAHGYNDTGGTASIRPYCTIGGVRYYGDASQMSAGTTDKVSYLWRLNPATSGFWTNSQLATTEFGFDVTEIT